MKKALIYTGSFILLIVILWIIGNATKTFTRFRSDNRVNEPTIKQGTGFFASSLKDPERFDFICVNAETKEMGKIMVSFRLCGIGGDVVEIKNGDLYVNHKNVDSLLTLSHTYAVAREEINEPDLKNLDPFHTMNKAGDTVIMNISDAYVKTNFPNAIRMNYERTEKNEHISKVFKHNWNADHFGPIRVPANHYFILGDNRHQAMDSRYIGFVPVKNFVATVLWKK
ncbi:MAG: signal peptidase I [Flavisolibacter sp.]